MKQVFVISDLHLGGRPDKRDAEGRLVESGSQICHSYDRLREFVAWLTTKVGDEVELVINGDFIDFLAEDDGFAAEEWTNDDEAAVAKLDRVVEARRAKVVFDALADFLHAGHRLTVLIGNHDLELSIPAVRARLQWHLRADATRYAHLFDGEAYSTGRLLIEHGNRYDAWNVVDHTRLRRERSARSRGETISEEERTQMFFLAPAGTKLVIHYMNPLKARYRFIDLLKPEGAAMIPILLALEPTIEPSLRSLVRGMNIIKSKWQHRMVAPDHPQEDDYGGQDEDKLDSILSEELGALSTEFPRASAASAAYEEEMGGFVGAPAVPFPQQVGGWARQFGESARTAWDYGQIRALPDGERRLRRLHAALLRLAGKDRSFDTTFEEPCYVEAAKSTALNGNFDAVVYGHTHLPKCVDLKLGGRSVYLNTGTWADVLRLPPALAGNFEDCQEELRRFVGALESNDYADYVQRYLTYAEIHLRADGRVDKAEIHSFCGTGRPQEPPLTSSKAGP